MSDYTPGWLEVRDAYTRGNSGLGDEFDRYEMNKLKAIVDRLRPLVYDSEPGPTISWNAVLQHLGYPSLESRVEFERQYTEEIGADSTPPAVKVVQGPSGYGYIPVSARKSSGTPPGSASVSPVLPTGETP